MADTECDVLIVGSGIGGLTATIAARMAGLKVLLIEQGAQIGGNTALSSGMLWLPNNPLMFRERVADSRAEALTYLANFVSDGDHAATIARHAAFVDGVAPLVALLEAQGVPLIRCDAFPDHYDTLPGGSSEGRMVETRLLDTRRLPGEWSKRLARKPGGLLARGSEVVHLTQLGMSIEGVLQAARMNWQTLRNRLTGNSLCSAGSALQGYQLLAALSLGADIRTNAGMRELISHNGRVLGAMVDFGGELREVHAHRGVVIAAGGFARNPAMRQHYLGSEDGGVPTQVDTGDTGEPINAMIALGAATAWMNEAWWVLCHQRSDTAPGQRIVPELHKPHVILVDSRGERFVNEAADSMHIARACRRPRSSGIPRAVPAWAIMDARHRYGFGKGLPGLTPRSWLSEGHMFRASSIEGLADGCGLNPQILEATVTRWNVMARRGRDEDFNKGDSAYNRLYGDPKHEPNPCMGTIERGPFYAAPIVPGDVGTCGGVVVDEHARVKRMDGSAIEGLYAVGNCTAPLTGPHDIAAGQNGATAAVFGMIAVRHLVS